MKLYSPYFKTLHDEEGPTGFLGRGTHYSILQTYSWQDVELRRLEEAHLRRTGIIWDEDHDERIIPVLENLHVKGLLAPALFIGERKGMFNIVTIVNMPHPYVAKCADTVRRITGESGDLWEAAVSSIGSDSPTIIAAEPDDVRLYLNAIRMLWSLGRTDPSTSYKQSLAN